MAEGSELACSGAASGFGGLEPYPHFCGPTGYDLWRRGLVISNYLLALPAK